VRKKHEEEGHVNHERWLLTYADLITLLMIFFIVLYTLSKVDADKFRAVAYSLNAAIGGGTPARLDLKQDSGASIVPLENGLNTKLQDMDKNSEAEAQTIQGIKKKIDDFVKNNGLNAKVQTNIEERGLVVSINETLLFASGSANITDEALTILQKLSTILVKLPNYIKVEGHTDNVPIHTSQFPSNWELSAGRAINVVHVLISQNIPQDKLSAAGYGEYRPVVPNSSDANRSSNRRVDLVLIRSKYDITEPQQQSPNKEQPAPSGPNVSP